MAGGSIRRLAELVIGTDVGTFIEWLQQWIQDWMRLNIVAHRGMSKQLRWRIREKSENIDWLKIAAKRVVSM